MKEGEVKRNKSNTLEGKIIKKDNKNFTDRNKVTFKGTEVTCRVARKTMNVCNFLFNKFLPQLFHHLYILNYISTTSNTRVECLIIVDTGIDYKEVNQFPLLLAI